MLSLLKFFHDLQFLQHPVVVVVLFHLRKLGSSIVFSFFRKERKNIEKVHGK